MDEEKIRSYLERQDFIGFQVHQAELDHPEQLQRYFRLLDYVGSQTALARKFCSRWGLSFGEDCGPALWENQGAVEFVRKLGEAFPFLFFPNFHNCTSKALTGFVFLFIQLALLNLNAALV